MFLHIKIREENEISNAKVPQSADKIKQGKISRKQFFKRIGLASVIPLAGIWYSTSKRSELREKLTSKITIPANLPSGISFFGAVIVSKNEQQIKVLSAKCTHLGCIINKTEDNILICPCHGSQYNLEGKVIKGPANKSLMSLPFKINSKTGEITVDVPA